MGRGTSWCWAGLVVFFLLLPFLTRAQEGPALSEANKRRLEEAREHERKAGESLGRGSFDEAEERLLVALDLRQRVFGRRSPELAPSLLKLGGLHVRKARAPGVLIDLWPAVAFYRRAVSLLEPTKGKSRDEKLAEAHLALGGIFGEWGNPGVGALEYEKAFRRLAPHLAPGHPKLVAALVKGMDCLDRSRSSVELVECARAFVGHTDRQLAEAEKKLGADHPTVAELLLVLALTLGPDIEAVEKVRACHERALAIFEKRLRPGDMKIGEAHLGKARFHLSVGEPDAFWKHYNAALAIWKRNGKSDLPDDLVELARGNSYPLEHGWTWSAVPVLAAAKSYRETKAEHGADSAQTLAASIRCIEALVDRVTGRDYPLFEQLADEGVRLSAKHHGKGSVEYADALSRMGQVLIARGRAPEAVDPLRACLKIRRARQGKRDPRTADAHAALGYALCATRKYDDSAKEYERCLTIREGKKGPEDPDALRARVNLAIVLDAAERYDKSHAAVDVIFGALERSEALRKVVDPKSGNADARRACAMLSTLCRRLGRHEDEVRLMEGTIGGPDRDEIYLAQLAGDYGKALRRAREMTGVGRRIKTANPPGNPYEWMKKAEALLALGAYEEAFADLLDTVEFLQMRAPDSGTAMRNTAVLLTGPALGMLAEAVLHRGLFDEACAFAAQGAYVHHAGAHDFTQSMSGRRASGRKDPSQEFVGAMVYVMEYRLRDIEPRTPEIHARALVALGNTDRALRVLEDALTDLESKLPAGHPRIAVTLGALARVHLATGRTEEARSLADLGLAILSKALGKKHPDLCDLLLTLADVEVITGRYAAAEKRYGQVLDISSKGLFDAHLNFPLALSGIAVARAKDGRAREALEPMSDALERVGTRARNLLPGATATERIALMASVHWALANWLLVTEAAGEDGYEAVLSHKGLIGRAMGIEQRLYRKAEGRARELYDELRVEERRLARVAHAVPRRSWSRLAWRRKVAESAERCSDLSKSLARAYGAFADARNRLDLDRKAVAGRLAEGEALADILLEAGRYTCWVTTSKGSTVRIDLGKAEELDPLMQEFREAVLEAGSTADDRYRKSGAALRERLWAPIAAALPDGTGRVWLVPDGAVCATPVRALPGEAAGTVLDDELLLARLTSAQDLVPWRPRPNRGRGVLVVGDVNFNATDRPQLTGVTGAATLADRVPGARRFEPLPGTRAEADLVEKLFPGQVRVLRAEGATEQALREAVPGSRVVHLATHGFLRKNMNCALRLPHGEAYRLRAGLELCAQRFDPLLMTGLALSGANVRVMENDDDGILTALEAMGLELDGTDLVVLSACETARGIEQAGEGAVGLVRGFSLAGAESVVASLWPVVDEATAAFMERFYHHLAEGETGAPAEALRAAAGDLRKDRRFAAPRHWSAFVAYGAGRLR